jgi:hypothetical protein
MFWFVKRISTAVKPRASAARARAARHHAVDHEVQVRDEHWPAGRSKVVPPAGE